MKTVYLLRHGEALHNLVDRGSGSYERRRDPSLVDPPLTLRGAFGNTVSIFGYYNS